MKITKYKSTRHWAVWNSNGELICVTVYKKGAEQVKSLLEISLPEEAIQNLTCPLDTRSVLAKTITTT